jgi:hypothetical protein
LRAAGLVDAVLLSWFAEMLWLSALWYQVAKRRFQA